MSMPLRAFVLAILISVAAHADAAPPIKVMLLDGESGGPWHKWQLTTPVLKKQLEDTGLFQVDVVTAPPAGGAFSTFKPNFGAYRVVVWNYDAPDERWSAELKAAFEQYVTSGGGVVIVHAADNAFPGWPAFNEMIGDRRLAQPGREGGSTLVHAAGQAGLRSLSRVPPAATAAACRFWSRCRTPRTPSCAACRRRGCTRATSSTPAFAGRART